MVAADSWVNKEGEVNSSCAKYEKKKRCRVELECIPDDDEIGRAHV